MARKTTEQFIREAREVHGNKDDLSKVEYKNNYTKVCIICPIHGEYWIRPHEYLRGCGCSKCSHDNRRLTDFIGKANFVHQNRYDYSQAEYKNYHSKVSIICPIHGEFRQSPAKHLSGQGCPHCKALKKDLSINQLEFVNKALTQDDFIKQVKEVHGDKFDLSKAQYKNYYTKVCVICPKHGEFWMSPKNLFNGQGCPHCQNRYLTTEEFIEMARKIHGDKYDYSKAEYVNNHTKVCIICPEHGEFWQTPNSHLNGTHCPKCAAKFAITETQLFESLTKEFPQCQFVHSFRNAEILDKQEIDIYSLVFKIAIEYQGKQHFEAIDFFGGKDGFEMQLVRDNLKIEKCNKANIKLFHFTYDKNYCRDNINYEVITDEETLFQKIRESLSERDSLSSN